jgi:glycosyltransferase involved in cell wall biosynthesis
VSLSRICVDGFNLAMAKGSGIATYARNLLVAQRALGYETQVLHGPPHGRSARSPLLSEVALHDATPPRPRGVVADYVDTLMSPMGRRAERVPHTGEIVPQTPGELAHRPDVVWAARDVFHRANRAFAASRRFTPVELVSPSPTPAADLMHWTCALPLQVRGAANIYTIHDVVPLRLPYATLDNKRHFHAMCEQICKTADHVVTVSETSRDDIIRQFGIAPERITNTYQAVHIPEALRAVPDADVAADIESIFSLGWKRYFLFFGAIEPKKNLARVIEAYLASGAQDPLVIIGGQSWLADDQTRLLYDDLVIAQTLADNVLRRSDRVRRYDYLPFGTLVGLIRGAKATLFPSLYEGFGLPVLESMLLGTPVLTSAAGALPEVAGSAALSVDPYDVRAIRNGIARLDADEGLRDELTAAGRVQAAAFSPERYKDRLGDLYRGLL